MMPGCTTLGLNSAFTLPGVGPAFARQPLPPWTDEGRIRPAHEPYQGWISPFGHLADGPLTIHRAAFWELCYRYYHSERAGCSHLTLAAQCWFNEDFGTLYVPSTQIRDYAYRPYLWREEEVQEAYETVSDGEVTASEIASLADIGKTINPATSSDTIQPTPAQAERIAEINGNWTEAAASFLAFGSGDSRPFRWAPGLHADEDMAPAQAGGYALPSPDVYGMGSKHEPYPEPRPARPQKTPMAGQGFMAWRKCRDGALVSDDWIIIADAIANEGSEAENALLRRRPLQACDIVVYKQVTLTRTFWRDKTDGKTGQTIGKEAKKNYSITCSWISGARPESLSGTPYAI